MAEVTRPDLTHALELHKAGRLADADREYARYLATHPDDPVALNNAAAAAVQLGNAPLAVSHCEKLIALDPRNPRGHNNLGYALIQAGRPQEAARCLERAIELEPNFALAHNNLGIAYEELSRQAEAIAAFERALVLKPGYADAAANLGKIFNREGDTVRARAALNRALTAQPSHLGAHIGLALVHAVEGDLEGALTRLEGIAATSPRHTRFWETLGWVRNWAGDLPGSEAAYRQALAINPHDLQAYSGLTTSLLARGDFAQGWRMFNEFRDGALGTPSRFGDIAQWDGGLLDGALLIISEQGLGDVVQFARLVPEARLRVRRLIFLADDYWRTLAPVLATLRGIDDLCTDAAALARLAERPVARASMRSLPYLLGLRIEALPGPIPYLSALPERVALWRPRLAAIPRPRIGLAWSTLPRHRGSAYLTRQKTVPPALLEPVIATTRASFVSLQLGEAGKLAPESELAGRIVDLTSDIRDFGDTAAIISELDLVISTDTSVAHVAGAMGKPVWMLDRYNTDWRWRLAEDRSPWYPTMRIFRQQRFGDWQEPIARLVAALGQFGG